MKILFLDDREKRIDAALDRWNGEQVWWAQDAKSAISLLKLHPRWDIVSLDHDLDGDRLMDVNDNQSGCEVARWIVQNNPRIDTIILHTTNEDGARYMASILTSYNVLREPMHIF